MKKTPTALALLLCLSACSPEPAEAPEPAPAENTAAPAPPAIPPPASSPAAPPEATPPAAQLLTLQGLGGLRIGEPVPAGSGWAERGARISDECRTVSAPGFPGVYAIVERGKVRRITLGERSEVTLAEGIGVGAAEAEVRAAFPGFREAAHKYGEAPAKYLTAPEAAGGDPALRFEIGPDGKVALVHVGTMPVLAYVEGCA